MKENFMKLYLGLAAFVLAASAVSVPAFAVSNLILNGSFETGDFTGFTHTGIPSDSPAVVLLYNNAAGYGQGGGAYGEAVPTDNASGSLSTDTVGTHAAYFSTDEATGETISQLTPLFAGNYEVGFDAYLPQNGFNNPNDATFSGQIIGVTVASFTASQIGATQWFHFSGVAGVTAPGFYKTSFTFNAFGVPAKDVVIDRVYAIPTLSPSTVIIPATPTAPLPEPAVWGLMVVGFGLVGSSLRRRTTKSVAA
jgi:hypothetical protein